MTIAPPERAVRDALEAGGNFKSVSVRITKRLKRDGELVKMPLRRFVEVVLVHDGKILESGPRIISSQVA